MSAGKAAYRMSGTRTYSNSSKDRLTPAFRQISKQGPSGGAADQKGGFHCARDCVLDLHVPFDVQEPVETTQVPPVRQSSTSATFLKDLGAAEGTSFPHGEWTFAHDEGLCGLTSVGPLWPLEP